MERLDIFPLKIMGPLALIRFFGIPGGDGPARIFFNYLHRHAISIALLTHSKDRSEDRDLVLVISLDALQKCESELDALRTAMQADRVMVTKPVAVIRLLGPHFDIRPGVAGVLFSRLMQAGIDLLANSTTITSSLLVVAEEDTEKAIRLLETVFRVPKNK